MPSGRASLRTTIWVAGLVAMLAPFAPVAADQSAIVLPSAPPGGVRVATQQLLPASNAAELPHAPGTVTDDEVVRVGVDARGAVNSVLVEQQLRLTGVGDFVLEIPGPATNVTASPEASPQPGLRGGSVIWQGFSPGQKALSATVTLDPLLEQARLPIAIAIERDDANAFVTIKNTTGVPFEIVESGGNPASVASALQAVRAALARGERPVGGAAGIPTSIPATGDLARQTITVMAPLHITGSVSVAGAAAPATIDATLSSTPDGPASTSTSIKVLRSDPISLHVEVTTALPDPPSPAASLGELETVMATAARSADFDAYLGVPVLTAAHTVFRYEPAQPKPRALPPPRQEERAQPFTIALSAVALLALVAVAWRLWSVS